MILQQEDLHQLVISLPFPVTPDTYEAVATVVLHAPPDMGEFSYDYVKNRVAKMMANKVAYDYLQEMKAKRDAEIQAKQAATQQQVAASGSDEVQKA